MNLILPSLSISILYIIYKIIDSKYISKEETALKSIFKDGLIVFLSGALSMFLIEQFKIEELMSNSKEALSAFTNEPDF
jgi:hypothetical protein